MNDLSSRQLCTAFEIRPERFREWLIRGYIAPTYPSEGQGKAAYWSLLDTALVYLFSILLDAGYSRETAAGFLKSFQRQSKPETAKYLLFRKNGDHLETIILPEMEGQRWFIDLKTTKTALYSEKYNKLSPSFDFTGVVQSWGSDWTYLLTLNFQQILEDVRSKVA